MRYNLILSIFTILISCVFAVSNGGDATVSSPQNSQPGSSVPQNGIGQASEPISVEEYTKKVCESHGHYGEFASGSCVALCKIGPKKVAKYEFPNGAPCGKGMLCRKPYCVSAEIFNDY